MQKHTSNIYRKLLHVIQRLYKHKHWIFVQDNASSQRSNLVEDFHKKYSIHVLSKHMIGLRRHLIATSSVTFSGIK